MTKKIIKYVFLTMFLGVSVSMLLISGCDRGGPKPGTVPDEAKKAGRSVDSFPAADEDYFHDMDGAIALKDYEVKGRNTWIVWTGGNDRLWDKLTVLSAGALDLLKTVSNHPSLKFSRDNRWEYLGVVNEPGFEKGTGPDPDRFGLWLDKRSAGSPPDPFEVSGGEGWGSRQEYSSRFLLRLGHGNRRSSPFSESGF
jgi:hypothetical protein